MSMPTQPQNQEFVGGEISELTQKDEYRQILDKLTKHRDRYMSITKQLARHNSFFKGLGDGIVPRYFEYNEETEEARKYKVPSADKAIDRTRGLVFVAIINALTDLLNKEKIARTPDVEKVKEP